MKIKIDSLSKPTVLIAFFTLLLSHQSLGQSTDTLKKKQHFEVSFGQSILFISPGQLASIRNQAAITVPTSAILFFVEFRPQKKIMIPVFFNLATESKQFLVAGQLINEKASPTFGSGLEFRIFQIKIDAKSKLELEMGPLASLIFDSKSKIRIAPVLAGRVRLTRGDNFVMYLGSSYSFGIDAFGLLYGTGTIF